MDLLRAEVPDWCVASGAGLHDGLDVSHYAGVLGVSPQTLSEACRNSTGVSAKTLISERVILEAKRLLCYSDMPVSEIATQIGYDDPLYFSRAFKQSVGTSPRAFRSNLSG